MIELAELLDRIRAAYNAGETAAHEGKMFCEVPRYDAMGLREAWENGWTDATFFMGKAKYDDVAVERGQFPTP